MQHDDFRSALEAIKLRAPIEDVVRERVPGLKKSGALWKACCPFHDERTPSFTVDPRRGTWHCFGACSTGGDQIRFLERFDNLEFMDAVQILAARTGVELPQRNRGHERSGEETDASLAVLEHATQFYRAQLRTSEGQAAVRYLRARGLSEATVDAFGIGYAPATGNAFLEEASTARLDRAHCEKASLVRHTDDGRFYDFFRGRLMIPIRDLKGRTVGFGARRLSDDDAAGPKYVNSAETDVFKKSTLIYALDRALPVVRKSAHIVLVEGYTDVMAAHQCGVSNVVAVLGTATTDDHAALVRRTGARRVSLVFDGDEAGRKAAYKALHGLLPLELEIDVVSLPGGQDPCDLLVREGAQAFLAQVELAQGWFDFLVDGLRGFTGVQLSREVDRVLELFARISKPVHRDSRIADLARALALPATGLREQFNQLPDQQGRRRQASQARPTAPNPTPATDKWTSDAFGDILGAVLKDAGVFPIVRPFLDRCTDEELARIFAVIGELYEDVDLEIDAASVITALGEDPARDRVTKSLAPAEAMGEDFDPVEIVESITAKLKRRELDEISRRERQKFSELESQRMREGGAAEAAHAPEILEFAHRIDQGLREARTGSLTPTQVED
ncbi:MAG: DNA primase [Planctomycetes bacterium]|nr:DNA primase [Planctomycetota bacterium]